MRPDGLRMMDGTGWMNRKNNSRIYALRQK